MQLYIIVSEVNKNKEEMGIMEYDYSSLKLTNEEIKYKNIYKVVRLKVKREGIPYSILLKEVKKIGGNEKYLKDILRTYYIVRSVNGIKKVYTCPGTSYPESIKVKMDSNTNSNNKDKQLKRANDIIYGRNIEKSNKNKQTKRKKNKQSQKKKNVSNTETSRKKQVGKRKQEEIDKAFRDYENGIKKYRAKTKEKNGIYDHVCYRFLTFAGEIIYVGRAENLVKRIESHATKGHLSATCYNRVCKIEFCKFNSEDDLDIAERYYISKFKPEYNVVYKDKKYFTIRELEDKAWEDFPAGVKILRNR